MMILLVGALLDGIAKEGKVIPEECYISIEKGTEKKRVTSKAFFESIPDTLGEYLNKPVSEFYVDEPNNGIYITID